MLLLVKNIPRYTSYRLLFDALTKDLCVSKKYIKLAYKPGKAVGYLRIRNKEEFLVEIRDNDKPIVHEDGKSNNTLVKDTEQVGENAEENKIEVVSDIEVGNIDTDKLNNICDIVSKGLDSANDALNDKSLENITKNGYNKNEELSSVQRRDVDESLNDKLDMKIFEFLCRKEIKLGKKILTLKKIEERPRREKPPTVIEDIRDVVTPLWKHSKETQLSMKLSNLNEFLEKNALHPINKLVSPVNTQRNNFEFAFGFNTQGRPCVGFRGQSFKGNKNLCYECTNVEFIGELRQQIDVVNEMVKNYEWMVYDREKGTGYLRMMKVRVVNGNEHLVLVDIDGSNESDRNVQECSGSVDKTNQFSDHHARDKTDQAIVNYEHFCTFFKSCIDGHVQQLYNFLMNLPFTNVSLAFNRTKFEGISPGPSLIIKGASHLFQHIHNLKFKISFFTFFQTNIEMLIAMVEQIKAVKKNNPYLLDLCCGSLVLGMMLCGDYKEVIGIENNLECVKDFDVNRDVNEVKNCRIMGVDVNTVSVREIVRSILKEKTASGVSDGLNEKELNKNGEGEMISSQNVSNEENQQSTEMCHINGEIATNDRSAVNKATDNTFATSYTTTRLENETINREENITVILDPPRAGVNKRLIKKLRECTAIDELFYISCDFNQSIGNIKDLTRKESNAYKSGFVVLGTYAFDMFAGNKKVEVLYHLRRSK